MWLLSAFISAVLLGFYDVFKKKALSENAVIPVLFLNTFFSSIIFLPFILVSLLKPGLLRGTLFFVPPSGMEVHGYVMVKSCIVLGSWICGYFGMKHLPITIAGPINTTRPVMVLLGAMIVFGERLNLYQWAGVLMAIFSFYMLGRSGRNEGIDFKSSRWIYLMLLAGVLGAASGLYDKFLLAPACDGGRGIDRMIVQSWFLIYQMFIMGIVLMLLWFPGRASTTRFRWDWSIICISLFLSASDFIYFYALSLSGSMISIVSMIRRGSVVISFVFGAFFFRESNLKSKTMDLVLVLIGLLFLYIGSR